MRAGACFLACGAVSLFASASMVAVVATGACFLLGLLLIGGIATLEIDFED